MQTSFRRVERKPEGLKVDSPKTVFTWVLLGKSLGKPGGGVHIPVYKLLV